jgi:hypothetical protein
MRRLGRWVLNGATALSVLLCFMAGAIWVRSYLYGDRVEFYYNGSFSSSHLSSYRGRLLLNYTYRTALPFKRFRDLRIIYSADGGHADVAALKHSFAAISWESGREAMVLKDRYRAWVIPEVYLVAIFGALPLIRLRKTIRWQRVIRPGHCHHCGYDLRATPNRCPECGTMASGTRTFSKV